MTSPPPLVLIHGLYMNNLSWEPWLARARAAGFDARAIEWPHHAGSPAELRDNPPKGLAAVRFRDALAPVKANLEEVGDNPVLIGHSIGGLMVLSLLGLGLGRAGVAITPAPPKGTLSPSPHFLAANLPHSLGFAANRILRMTPRRFHYAFANTDSRDVSDRAFDQWCVPESRRIPLSTLGPEGAVDRANTTQPLLLIGASRDHLIPAGMVRRIARGYVRAGTPAEYREVPGRSHLVCNQEGWETLADDVLEWSATHG